MVLRRNASQDRSRWRRPCRRRLAPQHPVWRDASTPISAWSTSEAPAMVATAIGNPWIAPLCKGLKRSACVSDILRSPGVHCVGHDDQPAPILVDTVANGPKNVSIRPVAKLPGRSQVGGHKQSDRHWKILGEVETAGERAGSGMATAAEAVGYRLAECNLFGRAGDL